MLIDFLNKDRLTFFDGAMGTMIQAAGLKGGELPEMYNITHPEVIESIHRAYIEAGADVITTNTFGANSLKLNPLGITPDTMISAAVGIARKAAGERLVALDIGPLGQLMAPMGTLTFQAAYDLFASQIKAGQNAGADLILIETMSDLYEAKAAVLAAKENSNLPVACTLTFQQNGRTLMGNDPLTVITVLEGLGVDVLGVNCSLGPKDLLPIVEKFTSYSHVPVLVQANAGLPTLVNGQSEYELDPETFADSVEKMVLMGVKMVGGCCGTNPSFIKALYNKLNDTDLVSRNIPRMTTVASSRQTLIFDQGFKVIGQSINPSGRDDLIEAVINGDMDILYDEAIAQKQAGAEILDINVYVRNTNEAEKMVQAIEYLQSMLPIPLQIDSADYKVLEAGARIYNGKPIINSVNGTRSSMEHIFPIVKKYGACVIALTMDEGGIPQKAEQKLEVARKILETAASYGILKDDIIVDCLMQSAEIQASSSIETLKAISLIKRELGVKTILEISNISYGMKERSSLNSAYLAMALGAGLDSAILDTSSKEVKEVLKIYRSSDLSDLL